MKKSQNSILRFSSRLFSVLLALMLVGVVFVPAVAAENVKLTTEDYQMELISTSGTTKEYMVYSDAEKTKPAYFVRSEQVVIDGKLVNTAKIYEVDENGNVRSEIVIGVDSYWWFDVLGGLRIHICPIDMMVLKTGSPIAVTQLIKFIGGVSGLALFAISLITKAIIYACSEPFLNSDDSLDVYISQENLSSIPSSFSLMGGQVVYVWLGDYEVPFII